MKLAVFSDEDQYRLFLKSGYLLSDFQILSDNPRFYDYLSAQKVPFEGIDEFLIEPEWQTINGWASRVMNRWSQFCTERKLFSGVNWCAVSRHAFSCILTQIAKNQRMAEIVFERWSPKEIILFEVSNAKSFPLFSGNACLNYFLGEYAAKRNIKTNRLVTKALNQDVLKGDFPVPRTLKSELQPLKRVLEKLSSFLRGSRSGEVDFIAFGSLRHLRAVLKELKGRGPKIALYDFEYHSEQLLFALQNGIKYWLPSFFIKGRKDENHRAWVSSQYAECLNAFQKAQAEGFFRYENYDYGQALLDLVVSGMEGYFVKLSKERMIYKAILESSRCKAWIVDDDFALKGSFLAAFLGIHGIKVYCVSHANLAVNFAVPAELKNFAQSTTFVHSEHEKNMYANRGWDPAGIVVTGTPRHDRIFQLLRQEKSPSPPNGKLSKLLFQATHLWPSSPDLRGLLGCHITNTGDLQAPAFRKVVNAAAGLPIELIVKPHDAEIVPSWKNFVREIGAGNRIEVTQHSEDFLALLAGCDGMISGCWSTSLIEAALLRKPVFFVAGKPVPNLELEQFAQNGFCQIFDEAGGLRAAFQKLCEIGPRRYFESILKNQETYYLGYQDGQSTGRVVDFLLSETIPCLGVSFRATPDSIRGRPGIQKEKCWIPASAGMTNL